MLGCKLGSSYLRSKPFTVQDMPLQSSTWAISVQYEELRIHAAWLSTECVALLHSLKTAGKAPWPYSRVLLLESVPVPHFPLHDDHMTWCSTYMPDSLFPPPPIATPEPSEPRRRIETHDSHLALARRPQRLYSFPQKIPLLNPCKGNGSPVFSNSPRPLMSMLFEIDPLPRLWSFDPSISLHIIVLYWSSLFISLERLCLSFCY